TDALRAAEYGRFAGGAGVHRGWVADCERFAGGTGSRGQAGRDGFGMLKAGGGGLVGEHAVYPGTFDPVTPGHLGIIDRARHLFARVTVLVAVNGAKGPDNVQSERLIRLGREQPTSWENDEVSAWAGSTLP